MPKKPDQIPAEAIAPQLRKEAELRELARIFTKYYNTDFSELMDAIQAAREKAEGIVKAGGA